MYPLTDPQSDNVATSDTSIPAAKLSCLSYPIGIDLYTFTDLNGSVSKM